MSENIEIPETILKQIGGRRFIVMTGASNLTGHPDALSFKLPSCFATNGINYVKITLTLMDTYDITFGRVRGTKYKVISTVDGVYVDDLRRILSETTGLALSL